MALAADLLPDPAFTLTLAADPVAVRNGLALLAASPPLADLSPDHRASAEIVLAEVLNNIAEHAYAGGPGDISVRLRSSRHGLVCRTIDQGRPMPGGDLPSGTLPEEELPEGGFGWFLIRSMTSRLDYERRDGENRLHFVIPAPGNPAAPA